MTALNPPLPCFEVQDRLEVLEGLLRARPAAGEDVEALLELAELLGLGSSRMEVHLLYPNFSILKPIVVGLLRAGRAPIP